MALYHWTINIKKLKTSGFRDYHSRHKDELDGAWFTDTLMGAPDSIRPGMRLVTVDIPGTEVELYEEINTGSGYRTFSIPTDIANQFTLNFPSVFSYRVIYKISDQ